MPVCKPWIWPSNSILIKYIIYISATNIYISFSLYLLKYSLSYISLPPNLKLTNPYSILTD